MKKSVTISDVTFTIEAVHEGSQWRAEARAGVDRVGPPMRDAHPDRAIERVTMWIVWQRDHDAKLRDLQDAEQVYHRTIAGSAFATPPNGAASEPRKDALVRLERARLALDAVRSLKPE